MGNIKGKHKKNSLKKKGRDALLSEGVLHKTKRNGRGEGFLIEEGGSHKNLGKRSKVGEGKWRKEGRSSGQDM